MISLLVVASTAFILISASSLYTVLSVSSTFTSTTSINFLSCLTSWSSVFSSLFVVIVILERSCCSVDPTVMLSMLKLRALKRLVTLKRTPGLFSTRADTMYHDPGGAVTGILVIDIITPSCSRYHVFEAGARSHEWVDVLVWIDRDVYHRCHVALDCRFDRLLQLLHRLGSYSLRAIRLGYLYVIRAVVLVHPAVAPAVEGALPLGHHAKHVVVHEKYYYRQFVKHRHSKRVLSHVERAVAGDVHHRHAWPCGLGSYRGRESKAHSAKAGRAKECAGRDHVKVERRPHLALSYLGRHYGVGRQQLSQLFERLFGRYLPRVVLESLGVILYELLSALEPRVVRIPLLCHFL